MIIPKGNFGFSEVFQGRSEIAGRGNVFYGFNDFFPQQDRVSAPVSGNGDTPGVRFLMVSEQVQEIGTEEGIVDVVKKAGAVAWYLVCSQLDGVGATQLRIGVADDRDLVTVKIRDFDTGLDDQDHGSAARQEILFSQISGEGAAIGPFQQCLRDTHPRRETRGRDQGSPWIHDSDSLTFLGSLLFTSSYDCRR